MKCPKCQSDNPKGMQFCGKCGAKLERTCPECSFLNPSEFDFCGKCGHDLRGAKEPAPLDYSQPHSYTPKFLADKILSTGKSLEGERKLVTVLFADVANYTSISEKLDPEEVRQIMDGCFKIIMDCVYRYEGTIDKFTGDGVMALFGAPLAHEDHAQRACYAALEMQGAIKEYGERVKKDCGFDFRMRVGLNSGPVIVGGVGNDLRMDYTAVGDTVNLASRMETTAEPTSVVVGPDTHRMARDFFEFETLGKKPVKGKEQPVEAYRLLRATQVATRIEAAVAKGLTRFVGREKEMAILQEAFEKAKSGSGQVVGIVGEAGVGKSRLVLELRQMLAQNKDNSLEGRCLHYGSSMPYVPLLDILRAYFDISEGEREFLVNKKMAEKVSRLDEKLKNVLSPLHNLFSVKVEDEGYLRLEPQKKRERIFEAIRDLLIRESENKPLVLAVDDLQWIDRTSNEFLNYFIDWLASSHILLVLLYRPEYVHQWGSKSYYGQIRVGQLSTGASAELVQAMLEGGEVAPELRELILNRAAGNPLFMEEFTHTLLEDGSIQKKDHQYVLIRMASEIQVPDTIQGIIAARMDRLDENLKRTMQVASVIGRDFAYRILLTVTGIQEDLKSYLMNLQGLEFIYEKSLFPELEYIFKHALIQEVAYNSLLIKRRKEIHERIGKAIEDIYGDRLEEFYEALAHHYSMAENWEKAFHYLRLSAEKAHRSYSTKEAFGHYGEALRVLGRLPDTEQNKRTRMDTILMAYTGMVALNFPQGSLVILEEGLKAAEELGDPAASLLIRITMGTAHLIAGNTVEGLKFNRKALEEAEKLGDESTVLGAAVGLCNAYLQRGEAVQMADVAPKAIALLEKRQATSPESVPVWDGYVLLLYDLGWATAMLGDFDEGEHLCEKAIRCASEVKSQYSLTSAHFIRAAVSLYRGRAETTLYHAREARRLCEEAQVTLLLGTCWMIEGFGYYYQDDFAAARDCAEKSMSLILEHRVGMNLPLAHLLSGPVSRALGDLPKARSSLEQAVKVAQDNDQKHYEAHARMELGRVLAEDISQVGAAEKCILEGMKMANDLHIRPFEAIAHLYLGETYSIAGQKEKALASLNKARQMCQEMGMDYYLARAEKALKGLKAQ